MIKIFKMDIHRLLHSKVFYVSVLFLVAMAVGQILGGMSTTLNGLLGVASSGSAEQDFMSAAMGSGVINILLSIVIAVFICGDYSGGFAKNIFAVHSDPKDYIGGKIMSMSVLSGFLLILYTIICVVSLAVMGFEVTLDGGIFGLVVFIIEKWFVSCALCSVVILAAVFTRNMAWTMFIGFLIATSGLTMGISLFAQAFGLEWIETVFSVLISGASKICTPVFDPLIFIRVLVTCAAWSVAAFIFGKKVISTKDL